MAVCERTLSAASVLCRICLLLAVTSASAAPLDLRPILLNNVVLVTAAGPKGELQKGFGFIVARVDDLLWIATAGHVVMWPPSPTDDQIAYDTNAYVELYGAPGERKAISAPPKYDKTRNVDVAFFSIRSPRIQGRLFDDWRTPVLRLTPSKGEAVQIAASVQRSIELAPEIGHIEQVPVGGDVLSVIGLVGTKGQSGAPVMSSAGIVGMHVATGFAGPTQAKVIPSALIRSIAIALQVPWQLTSNDAAPDESFHHVCVRHLGSEQPPVRLGASALIAIDKNGGCGDMNQGGELKVLSADFNVRCLPASVILGAAPNAEVALNCEPAVAGQWQQGPLGGAQVTEISERDYAFSGLPFGPCGAISGRLQGSAKSLIFNGQTVAKQVVLGSATVTRSQMLLQLSLPDQTKMSITLLRPAP